MLHRSFAAVLLAVTLKAQTFTYTDFGNVASLALLGNAAQSGTALRLTPNTSNQTGWAWHRTAMPVVAGFDTTFTFRITPHPVGPKAEGMALVLHDDPAALATMGGTVWGMGYGNGANGAVGIRNSIAIELDTFQDGFLADTSANEVTIHTRGATGNHEHEQYSIARATPVPNLSDGQVHTLRVRYVPGTVEVFVDNATTPVITRAFDLLTGGLYLNGQPVGPTNLVSGTAWLGFCATTGANTLAELVEILSWTWTSTPLRDACYEGTLGENALRIGGNTGGPLRRIGLPTFQPFAIDMLSPSGFGPGAPWVLVASLQPSPGVPGTALPFGSMCMPVFPFGPTELVLADSSGVLGGLLPAGLAPHTLAIPAGVVTFALDVTLQGVILAQSNPFTLATTNAIDVTFAPAPAPAIATVNPLSAQPGQTITVTGTGFLPGSVLAVNGTAVAPTTSSTTQFTFPYPAGTPCGSQVAVTLLDGQTATRPFNPNPTVTSTVFGSGSAAGNQNFLVNGTGFAPGTTVTIGGAPAVIQTISASNIFMRTPAGTPGAATVVITTPGGCATTTTYTYL